MPSETSEVAVRGGQFDPHMPPRLDGDGKSAGDSLYKQSKNLCEEFLQNDIFMGFMSVLVMWTLISEDVRLSSAPKSLDIVFEGINSVIFFLFSIEILLSMLCKKNYFILPQWNPLPNESFHDTWRRRLFIGSFYFWGDVLSNVTMILEIRWMVPLSGNIIDFQATTAGESAKQISIFVKQYRIKRLIRYVRLVRLLKYLSYKASKTNKLEHVSYVDEEETSTDVRSHVGAKMSDLTNQRVFVLWLSMVLIIPALVVTPLDTSLNLGTRMISRQKFLAVTNSTFYNASGVDTAINIVRKTLTGPSMIDILFIYGNHTTTIIYYDASYLRDEEIAVYTDVLSKGQNVTFTTIRYNIRTFIVEFATYNFISTAFAVIILVSSSYMFSRDVAKLVIKPIERMVELVKKISANPLEKRQKNQKEENEFQPGLETTELKDAIEKIAELMRIGFGDAGARVIARNLKESRGGALNLMGTGTEIRSIFGFCDIRKFTDTTECLQEEVMLFVNRIAHILHTHVVKYAGSANKNIGDAFLLTWKIDDETGHKKKEEEMADQALLALLKTLVEISRREEFICDFSAATNARLYNTYPNYKVRIGCGLHVGWAIEGAIGTNRKIDATYLSPYVNFTEFLENSTKEFGVPLLMSEPFYRMLSPTVQRHCRQVDCIRRSDSEAQVGLFTYDCDLTVDFMNYHRPRNEALTSRRPMPGIATVSTGGHQLHSSGRPTSPRYNYPGGASVVSHNPTARHTSYRPLGSASYFNTSASRRMGAEGSQGGSYDEEEAFRGTPPTNGRTAPKYENLPNYNLSMWAEDNDLIELRHRWESAGFREKWNRGMSLYLRGKWKEAKVCFEDTYEMAGNDDGPSKFLLDFMADTDYVKPDNWDGFRTVVGGH